MEKGSSVEHSVTVLHQSAADKAAKPRTFEFTHVYGPDSRQEDVFADTAPLMTSVLDGYNVCIFAYGQSGTGKTFTMEGSEREPGLAPRAMTRLFEQMDERASSGTFKQECFLSMLEIHNETIRDLLAPPVDNAAAVRYDILHDAALGMYVKGLASKPVDSAASAHLLVKLGNRNRAVGVTNLNEQSSRSHMLIGLIVLTTNKITGARHVGKSSSLPSPRARLTECFPLFSHLGVHREALSGRPRGI